MIVNILIKVFKLIVIAPFSAKEWQIRRNDPVLPGYAEDYNAIKLIIFQQTYNLMRLPHMSQAIMQNKTLTDEITLSSILDKSITSINIPYGVTIIGSYAFFNCSNLSNVIISDSVTQIDSAAFQDCTSLKNVVIPSSVRYIGWVFFYNCNSLTNITIQNGMTSIGRSAFNSCSSIISIIIPESCTNL